MAALRFALALAGITLASACAQAPVQPAAPAEPEATLTLPLVTSSGLVIGTVSYQFVELGAGEEPRWVVHVERVDGPAQDYALPVEVDRASRRGIFTGALPAGRYALREAASATGRYAPEAAQPVFEVQAGEVRDAGHYALNPKRGL
ncbi:MAG: hypothetical protein ACRES8_06730 [Nevskiaceae bacterium]